MQGLFGMNCLFISSSSATAKYVPCRSLFTTTPAKCETSPRHTQVTRKTNIHYVANMSDLCHIAKVSAFLLESNVTLRQMQSRLSVSVCEGGLRWGRRHLCSWVTQQHQKHASTKACRDPDAPATRRRRQLTRGQKGSAPSRRSSSCQRVPPQPAANLPLTCHVTEKTVRERRRTKRAERERKMKFEWERERKFRKWKQSRRGQGEKSLQRDWNW